MCICHSGYFPESSLGCSFPSSVSSIWLQTLVYHSTVTLTLHYWKVHRRGVQLLVNHASTITLVSCHWAWWFSFKSKKRTKIIFQPSNLFYLFHSSFAPSTLKQYRNLRSYHILNILASIWSAILCFSLLPTATQLPVDCFLRQSKTQILLLYNPSC